MFGGPDSLFRSSTATLCAQIVQASLRGCHAVRFEHCYYVHTASRSITSAANPLPLTRVWVRLSDSCVVGPVRSVIAVLFVTENSDIVW